jgi:hypothetical protein
MHDRQDPKHGRTMAIMVAAFVIILLFLTWAPWNPQHVASNPGPTGMPGSTAVERAPPPAASPSGDTPTTGMAR